MSLFEFSFFERMINILYSEIAIGRYIALFGAAVGLVSEVRNRLKKIKVSAIFESGNIEKLIADKTFTLFPLALNTERPDTVAANLMEGK